MCWNREVSLITGTTATAFCGYLLIYGKGNDIPVALVSLAVALMQFAEAFLWEGIKDQDLAKTTRGGNLGLIALFLQPLALGVGIAWIRGPSWSVPLFAAIWGIVALPTLLPLLRRKWTAQAGPCGHLQWSFLEPMLTSAFAPLYWVVMLGGWLLFKPFTEGIWYSAMAVSTLLLTALVFPGEWGSLWCFLANILPLGRILG
jgi:hypothetical protein